MKSFNFFISFFKNYLKLVRICNYFVLCYCEAIISASHCDSKIESNYLSALIKLAKVWTASAELWTEVFGIKNKKLLKKHLSKFSPKINPWDTLEMTGQTHFVHYLVEHIFLQSKSRCSKANHYLDHILRVLWSISCVICSQQL